jgi:hypothetical protein
MNKYLMSFLIGGIFANQLLAMHTFYKISLHGQVIYAEPNNLILFIEIVAVTFLTFVTMNFIFKLVRRMREVKNGEDIL